MIKTEPEHICRTNVSQPEKREFFAMTKEIPWNKWSNRLQSDASPRPRPPPCRPPCPPPSTPTCPPPWSPPCPHLIHPHPHKRSGRAF